MFRPRRPSTSRSSAPSTSATFSARSSTVSYPPSLPSLCGAHHLWVGLELFTFFAAVYCIWGRSSDYRKGRVFYVAYGGVLLMLVTIAVVTDGLWDSTCGLTGATTQAARSASLPQPETRGTMFSGPRRTPQRTFWAMGSSYVLFLFPARIGSGSFDAILI